MSEQTPPRMQGSLRLELMKLAETQSSIHLDIHVGEALLIDDGRISVELEAKSGKIARLRVVSPRDMTVERRRMQETTKTTA